jgi:uncharacterized protein YbjQ (UPF0145 family)
MCTPKSFYWLPLAALLFLAGCASYRTDSGVSFKSTENVATQTEVVIASRDELNHRFRELGPVEATVKKLTAFHADPTEAQANVALAAEAKKLGADAVIDVTYKSGIGWTSWGVIKAKGTAVKFLN